MRAYYDETGDLISITLADGVHAHAVQHGPVVLLFDAEKRLLGIDVMDASKSASPGATAGVPHVTLDFLPLAQVAEVVGALPATLLKAIQRGQLQAVQVGRHWHCTLAAARAYLDAPSVGRGRPRGTKAVRQASA